MKTDLEMNFVVGFISILLQTDHEAVISSVLFFSYDIKFLFDTYPLLYPLGAETNFVVDFISMLF
jgi:hypothetical protein